MSQGYVAGARIRVRDAEWVVRHFEETSYARLIHAVGLTGLVRDKEAIFVEAIETRGRHRIEIVDPADVALVPDTSAHFIETFLHLEAALRQSAPSGEGIHVAGKAAIDDLPFQLDPVRLALKAPRVRILIGDDVGLGKTLEAGLLTAELILRRRARRILVVATKAMLEQFQKEFWTRFSIPLVRLDSAAIQKIRSRIPTNHNPFDQFDRAIISIDTLKNDLQYRTSLESAWWDLIIIDEAHNVAERRHAGGASQRHALADRLSSRSDALVLLSATPHDGSQRSFASLMRMLDPTSIADPDNYGPDDIKGLFLRRFRTDAAVKSALKSRIAPRETFRATVPLTDPEEQAFALLADLSLHSDSTARAGTRLFRTTLEKAMLSSPAAAIETIENRLKRAADSDEDRRALQALCDALRKIGPDAFSKYRRLVDILGEIGWSPRPKDDRLVIFSERIATLTFLHERLRTDLGLGEAQVQVLHASGAGADIKVQKIVSDFGYEPAPVRILLASDMASEGLNLHKLSHRLFHFDIPWSLMTFQQRNGRIDRYGQKQSPQIWYFLSESRLPRIRADMRILDKLIEKDQAAQENIGDPSAFLGTNIEAEQEDIVAARIEAGTDADTFAAEMDARAAAPDDAYALLDAFFAGSAETPPPAIAEDRPSVFGEPYAFMVRALEWLREKAPKEEKPDFHINRDEKVIDLLLSRAFDAHGLFGGDTRAVDPRWMPPEAVPASRRIQLTPRRELVAQKLEAAGKEEAEKNGSGWPSMQYLWDVHPVLDWIADKAGGAFGRRQAPVARLAGVMAQGEVAFVFNGVVPNKKGQPLLDEWPVAVFEGEAFRRVEPFADFKDRVGLAPDRLPNPGTTAVDDLRALIPEAVDRAQGYISQRRRSFQAALDDELQDLLLRLQELRPRHERQIEMRFENARGAAQTRRDRAKARLDDIFRNQWDWIEKTRQSQDDSHPYVRLVAVFRG